MNKQKGFTLIELLIVVIIIGTLAAYAVPKYMDLDKEARVAVTKGLKGSIHAAADMVHVLAIMRGASGGTVNIGGGYTVTVANNYPTADASGIVAALADTSGFNAASGASNTITFSKNGAPDQDNCWVKYVNPGTVGTSPFITIELTGC